MTKITEILGENKVANGKNQDIKIRTILTQPSTTIDETNKFLEVDQGTQFRNEKLKSNIFRFYGKISPIQNKKAVNLTNDNKFVSVKLDPKLFDFNNDNWSVVLLKTSKSGNNKGEKIINNIQNNTTYDFNKGLPAMKILPGLKFGDNKKGFILYLGHNFRVNDKIFIDSSFEGDLSYVSSGVYTITNIVDKYVFIDLEFPPQNTIYNTPYAPDNTLVDSAPSIVNNDNTSDTVVMVKDDTEGIKLPSSILRMVEMNLNSTDLSIELNSPRPNSYKLLRPQFYIKKIVENELLEYYVKSGEVIGIVDAIDDCAFSLTSYGENNKTYIFSPESDLTDLTDHLNYPLNEIYIGLIKNGATTSLKHGDVESNFSELIEFTNNGEGIETIHKASLNDMGEKIKLGDKLFLSLNEYSTENLQENEITTINHRFIFNDVLFNYNPFSKITLKRLTDYILEAESNSDIIPDYAIFSKQKEKFIWRNILDIGTVDSSGKILNFPFMNGAYYVYNNITFNLKIEKNKTPKYDLTINDITNINALNDGNTDLNNILTELNSITENLFGNINNVNLPFKNLGNIEC